MPPVTRKRGAGNEIPEAGGLPAPPLPLLVDAVAVPVAATGAAAAAGPLPTIEEEDVDEKGYGSGISDDEGEDPEADEAPSRFNDPPAALPAPRPPLAPLRRGARRTCPRSRRGASE